MKPAYATVVMVLFAGLPAWAASSELSRQGIQWLDRVTYGPTTATADEYTILGRRRFLKEQLHPKDIRLPQLAASQIDALEISHSNNAELLAAVSRNSSASML